MTDYKEKAVTKDKERYLTEVEIRALLDSRLNHLTGPVRLLSGSISGTGEDPWELTPSEMNIKLGENSEPSIQGWANTMTFSAVDHDTVEWSAGSITLTSGKEYSISSGNTGNISAVTYIYLDVGTSETALQTTTTASSAVGSGKILVAVAENVASGKDATFQVFGGAGISTLITADNIAANSITANEIAANTITASQIAASTITATRMDVSKLSAIAANLGTITAGDITSATYTSKSITTSSGRSCKIDGDSSKNIKFYYNNNLEAWIQTNLSSGGENEYARFESDSGRSLRLRESNAACDGNFVPTSDNAYTCGASTARWSDGRFEDINVDDLTVNDSFNPPGINEMNLLTDEQLMSFKSARDKKFTKKEVDDRKKLRKNKKRGDIELELQKEKHLAYKEFNPTGFELGDVLVWKNGELVLCKTEMNTKVMAVSSSRGLPCVMGGEPIKVIGKVEEGDFLVTSSTKGYAKAEKEPKVGTVIAQALESSNKKGLIKAMIRKF